MDFIETPVERTMQITEQISTETACRFLNQFNKIVDLAKKDEKEKVITIQICCGGGSVPVALGFIDLICLAKKEITIQTVGIGHVGSAAVPILMSGTNRYVSKNCEIFVHNGRFECRGKMNSAERKSIKKQLKRIFTTYNNLVVEYSKGKMSKEEFEKLCAAASYISGQDIINYGFADEIL
ncbi:MAG TPA: ATP-dependent Clp protease proteolytic subunit [Candidatus Pacearchaeota archaeon]|nr:ATP-dependent Clp protease proteolytic subunit [Candidatus Pacearchaeota archaeon]HPM08783.1 ATP-dependent Clp protease proteolytic subunit [Candidatus Pacearchaeota archaeon]